LADESVRNKEINSKQRLHGEGYPADTDTSPHLVLPHLAHTLGAILVVVTFRSLVRFCFMKAARNKNSAKCTERGRIKSSRRGAFSCCCFSFNPPRSQTAQLGNFENHKVRFQNGKNIGELCKWS